MTSILSPYHFRNWELDPSTALSQSFDHCEIFGTFYDNFITPSPVLNQTYKFHENILFEEEKFHL
ncbi:unnamed protein product [Wuchereria bancrofti]|uniref:Uncharacterized protein n=1 Tax=Wuchereria bancrofti TaxID=6293 RepID=A0A3P7GGM5_WUCBA|nr:unnamed protein product [Wuchereria bancrofti]